MTRPAMPEPEVSPNGAAARPGGGVSGSPAGGAARPTAAGWGLPLAVLIAGMFMSVLDTSIVNVALPAIQKQFGVGIEDSQWVTTGYLLMLGVVVPASPWLSDRFGLTRVYNLALLAFAAGSALCGLAWDLNSLVIFRIVQAIPGGILPVITLSMVFRIVPRERVGAAMGLYGLGIVVAPAVGPTLGGYLVEYHSWPLIFFINVPIGILGAVASVLVLPAFPGRTGRRFDVLGFVTVAGGLFTLLLAMSKGGQQDWGWHSYRILGLFTVSALSLALFVVIELEVAEPILDLRVFRHWAFSRSMLLITVLSIVLFATLLYIPQFLQVDQGWGAFEAGLVLLPQALVIAVLMPITGRVYDRIGPRWPATIGLAIMAVGTYELHTLTIDTPRERVMWLLVGQGVGLGMCMMSIFTSGLAVLPVDQVNTGSAFNNITQRVSASFGIAVFTTFTTSQTAQQMAGRAALLHANTPFPNLGPTAPSGAGLYAVYKMTMNQATIGAMDDQFMIAAGLCALGVLMALWLRSGPAPSVPDGSAPPQRQVTSPTSVDGGPVADGAVERDLIPSTTAAGDDRPARRTDGLGQTR
ncbi:MAG: multidrug efflux MFS transporter [Pseudonocardiales bacterium]|nr:multidrug efflux MFS transporter [Pseudonocardiales bacterium]MBV9029254.1 multidrug efflux MFS transporter [Pseudonocardiales bacterium]MBW0011073.1 multidrug efflux MFS transporter [Pseudonocardiales bacterium]